MTEPLQSWSAPYPDAIIEPVKTNWFLATIASLGVGLAAAVLYALISVSVKSEILFLIIAVGAVVGIVVVLVAKVDNVATGLLSSAIAVVSIAVAIFLLVASATWGSVGEAFSHIGDNNLSVVYETYFSDPLGYVWAFAGLVAAYYFGSGQSKKGKNTPQVRTIDPQTERQNDLPHY